MRWMRPHRPQLGWIQVAAVVCVTASSGCTSIISSAYLREAWLDAIEHAADAKSEAGSKNAGTSADASDEADSRDDPDGAAVVDSRSATGDEGGVAAWSPATLDEAVREADDRLVSRGGLTAAARSTLIATLEATPRQDWPVVVEEFTAALAAAHAAAPRASPVATPTPNAEVAEPPASQPPMPPEESMRSTAATSPKEPAESEEQKPAALPTPEPVPAPFTIQNACFASRVRAWGVVDRFETAEFAPGQEVIVYFELDQLASRESEDGHTTRIDTVLALVDGEGRRVHEWTFEPLEETCSSRRRDYFARYLVTMPDSLPRGACRIDLAVTDTLSRRTAHAKLPLQVIAR